VKITVETNLKSIEKALRLARNQIPFATSYAINQVAADVRKEVKEALRDQYTIRNKWTEGGIRMNASTKKNLEAEVGSLDPYMKEQAEGGERRPGEGKARGSPSGRAKRINVPVEARKAKGRIVKRKDWPGKVIGDSKNAQGEKEMRDGYFFQEMKSGAIALMQKKIRGIISRGPRKGQRGYKTWYKKRRGQKPRRAPARVLWIFVRRVRMGLKYKWNLYGKSRQVVEREWHKRASDAIFRAMTTARRKAKV